MVAAGEALNPEVLRAWHEATGLGIRDGYGQTETGQLTGAPLGEPARPGLDGAGAAGRGAVGRRRRADGRPARRVPTFFLGYLGEQVDRGEDGALAIEDRRAGPAVAHRRPRREDEDGWLYFEGRDDDVIVSAGYRIGPFEVESALVAHPAVAEAAAVAAPDEERGCGRARGRRAARRRLRALARSSRASCRSTSSARPRPTSTRASSSSPTELPKTASGKVKRAELRARAASRPPPRVADARAATG